MKDLKGFVMYGGSALAVILVLVALGTSKQLSGATMGMIAIIAVVVIFRDFFPIGIEQNQIGVKFFAFY